MKITYLLIICSSFLLFGCKENKTKITGTQEVENTKYYKLLEVPKIQFMVGAGAIVHTMPKSHADTTWAAIPTLNQTLRGSDAVTIHHNGIKLTAEYDDECPAGLICIPVFVKGKEGPPGIVMLFVPPNRTK